MLKTIFGIVLFLLLVITPKSVNSANEFSTSYDITYSVTADGITEVNQDIKLKNLTDKFFPSSFSLLVPGSEISDIKAFDSQGELDIQTSREGTGTKIVVKFTNQQIIGLNKEYNFKLNFKDKGIAKGLGKVWSIKIPKIAQQTKIEDFSLVLSVPTSFGDPDYILPPPSAVNESGGKINLTYRGDSAFQSGISAIFGQSLNFSFDSFYSLKSDSLFPRYTGIPVALSSNFQKTLIENIEPRPENSEIDEFGNTIVFFKLSPAQTLNVKVSGFIQTNLKSPVKEILSAAQIQKYLEENKYWDANNPQVKAKLSEILRGKESAPVLERAGAIDKYVSNFLNFDYSRIDRGDFARFGSLTALNNPDKALSGEFVDLELALLRSDGIPARQVIGFSLPQEGKPFSYQNRSLHSWIEIYDQDLGWITADPAWQNTTQGTVLFNFNDLNHLGLVYSNDKGKLILPDKVETKLFDGEVEEKKGAKLDINISPEILSGFPSKARIKINNLGNTTFPESRLVIDTSKILIERNGHEPSVIVLIDTPKIPPFGNIEYDFNLKTGAVWNSYQDAFQVRFADVTDTRIISVNPILSYKIFAIEIFGALIMIAMFYILVLLIHHKSAKKAG